MKKLFDKLGFFCFCLFTLFIIPIGLSVSGVFFIFGFFNKMFPISGPPAHPVLAFISIAPLIVYWVVKIIRGWYRTLFWSGFRNFRASGGQELSFDSSEKGPSQKNTRI